MGTLFHGAEETLDVTNIEQVFQIFSSVFNSVVTKGANQGVLHYVSENVTSILGYTPEEMKGKRITSFLHEKDRKDIFINCKNTPFEQKEDKLFTVRLKKKDGTYLWTEITVITLRFLDIPMKSKEQLYIIKEVPIDKEENLLQNDKLAVIGQLAAGIAHEIRNPLTSLKGFIQLMRSDKSFNEQYLKIMDNEINVVESISRELMVLAKPQPEDFKLCDIQTIFENCMTLLEGEIFQKRVKIIRKYSMEKITVLCDEQKIKQVLINLVKNALDAMEGPGNITVKISKRGNHGVISIKDEGVGIPNELIDKLGKPFFTTKSNGNGLGLMMSFKIIEEHNGKIAVKSEPGVGTVFTISIPLHD
ncbi:ATP-binding protein [Caldibacillus lycopersici]|uniref:histidine kinase n=1 Tax=Perspicuibacillus lycopersici TaxID=1325689 RepID=A0AAE3IQI2_9BACI|nr:ATP-binding protein [Perspicuibacillus lycopersici]MCU9612541.1 ATP-binding protein [Perspicuibacillus lycopersici]